MNVYAHRFQTALQHFVVDLGLGVTLSDTSSPIALQDNEQMLTDLAASMNITVKKDLVEGSVFFTFQKKP